MATTPEALARQHIDAALTQAGWTVQDRAALNVHAHRGVAVREFALKSGHGSADYLLFVDQEAVGAVEAKPLRARASGSPRQYLRRSLSGHDRLSRASSQFMAESPLPRQRRGLGAVDRAQLR